MKTFIILCTLVVVVFGRPEVQYTDKYDTVNLDEILDNKKVLEPFIKCGLELGKCSPEGRELKCKLKCNLKREMHRLKENLLSCSHFWKNDDK